MVERVFDIMRILTYVNGLLHYYGAMHIKDIHRIVAEKIHKNIKLGDLHELLEDAYYDECYVFDYDFEDDVFFNEEVVDFYWVLSEHRIRKKLKFRPVEEEEAMAFTSQDYFKIWNDYIKEFHAFLMDRVGLSQDEAKSEVFLFQSEIRNNSDLGDATFDFINDFKLNNDEIKDFISFIKGIAQCTSLWALKGWSAEEIGDKDIICLTDGFFETIGGSGTDGKEAKDKCDNILIFPPKRGNIVRNPDAKANMERDMFLPKNIFENGPVFHSDDDLGRNKLIQEIIDKSLQKEKVEPDKDNWEMLYLEAQLYKKLSPWRWMSDGDTFAVMDPVTRKIAYCSILGALGELLGIGAYIGNEGYDILQMMKQELSEKALEDCFFRQKCLMLTFESRNMLTDKDRAVIKSLGLKFRGANEWPLFRSYEPGFSPWYFKGWESRFMTHILSQSIYVAERCMSDKSFLMGKDSGKMLIRVPDTNSGYLRWHSFFDEPPEDGNTYHSYYLTNEIAVKKMKKDFAKDGGVWEADIFYIMHPIKEGKNERPYYMMMFLVVEKKNGIIICNATARDLKNDGMQLINAFVNIIIDSGILPSRIQTHSDETYFFLIDLCNQMGIKIERTEHLEFIPDIKNRINQPGI